MKGIVTEIFSFLKTTKSSLSSIYKWKQPLGSVWLINGPLLWCSLLVIASCSHPPGITEWRFATLNKKANENQSDEVFQGTMKLAIIVFVTELQTFISWFIIQMLTFVINLSKKGLENQLFRQRVIASFYLCFQNTFLEMYLVSKYSIFDIIIVQDWTLTQYKIQDFMSC